MLRGEVADGARNWPDRLRPALATRGFAEELRDVLMRAAERGLDGKALRQLGRRARPGRRLGGGGRVPRPLLRALRPRAGARLRLRGDRQDRREPAHPAGHQAAGAGRLRRGVRRRVPGLRPGAGGPAAGARRRRPGPGGGGRPGPVDLRVPRRGRARAYQLPRPLPRPGRRAGPGRRAAHLPPQRPVLLAASRRVARRLPAAPRPSGEHSGDSAAHRRLHPGAAAARPGR